MRKTSYVITFVAVAVTVIFVSLSFCLATILLEPSDLNVFLSDLQNVMSIIRPDW